MRGGTSLADVVDERSERGGCGVRSGCEASAATEVQPQAAGMAWTVDTQVTVGIALRV